MDNPIVQFGKWWEVAKKDSPLQQKSAVCVSTITQDGFPSGRFVDLKAADEKGFTFCTYLDSKKGKEIEANPKVAITIWWDHVGFQVRALGTAEALSDEEALKHWASRSRDAQITTLSCSQSKELKNEIDLQRQVESTKKEYDGNTIPKPTNWGGYIVAPNSIEFLTFKKSRLHLRELFTLADGVWSKMLLQP